MLGALCLTTIVASAGHNDTCGRELDEFRQRHAVTLTGPDAPRLTPTLRAAQRLCQDGMDRQARQQLDDATENLRSRHADPIRNSLGSTP
jgi:hypothetical protein